MKAKAKTIRPVHPNAGIEVANQKKLDAMIDAMNRSVSWWVKAAYRANNPEMAHDTDIGDEASKTVSEEIAAAIQQTGSPARVMQNVMRKLSKIWQKRFDDGAEEMAKHFAKTAAQRTDAGLRAALKKSGMTVEFKMTAKMNDVLQATIGENVGLIKNIASEHLSDVQGLVMRSVSAGRDLGTLTAELQKRYGITRRRAALISGDQNNKLTANLTIVRQRELGITEAKWMHSGGGKEPRPEHLAWNGKTYKIDEGMWSEVDQKFVFPGSEINCRCMSRSILSFLKSEA